jgi:hypothetical protein
MDWKHADYFLPCHKSGHDRAPGVAMTDPLRPKDRIRLPEGFRLIRREDVDKEFSCLEPRMDRYPLRQYYEWGLEPDALVIIREVEGQVAGVQYLTVRSGYIMLEMLARNKLLQHPGAGGDLVRVVERVLAPQLGIYEIRMEALHHVIRYYDDVLGYEEMGKSYRDPEGGLLTPKRKLLPRRP